MWFESTQSFMENKLPKEYEAVVEKVMSALFDTEMCGNLEITNGMHVDGNIEALSNFIAEQLITIHTKHQEELEKTKKAFGGCTKCYGKGYATVIERWTGCGKFDMGQGDIKIDDQKQIMKFCTCERGKQLQTITNKEI